MGAEFEYTVTDPTGQVRAYPRDRERECFDVIQQLTGLDAPMARAILNSGKPNRASTIDVPASKSSAVFSRKNHEVTMKRVTLSPRRRRRKLTSTERATMQKADILSNVAAIVQSGISEHLKLNDNFGPSSVSKLRGMAAMLEVCANMSEMANHLYEGGSLNADLERRMMELGGLLTNPTTALPGPDAIDAEFVPPPKKAPKKK